jgi:hypothetical protein
LPLGGIWTPDEATAINALMADKNARYQVTGPKAFNRYGYSEQLPALTTIYNDAISGERRVGSVSLKLIKVARDRLGGVEKVRMPSGETLVYSSRARALVDAVYDWSQFDSLPEADLPPLNVATFRERISGGANQGRARDATRKEVHCGADHRVDQAAYNTRPSRRAVCSTVPGTAERCSNSCSLTTNRSTGMTRPFRARLSRIISS